ncbi:MAG TPA: PP2C family protein-serine/threonine phosphatase, partial [bacterium]|nr:PP2C family protein-serine/threonine phosphatase [bacterium]
GDYYDFVRLADWRCGIAVADVSGKGTSAAFYMAEIKGIIQALAGIYSAPKDLLIAVNDVLFGTIDRKSFITLLYADVDISKSELRFARAGHCPLLHMRDGVKTYVQPNGIGLGLDKGNLFRQAIEEKTIRIDDRDVFVMYSDGLVEARNAKDEEYGEERLSKCLDGVEHLPAGVIKDKIIADVKRFVGSAKTHDDLTCVVFRLADLQKQVVPVAPVTEAETGEITAVRRV